MFQLSRDDDGVLVEWENDDVVVAKQFRRELVLRGASRGREADNRLTVPRYRNELETLELVLGLLDELGAEYELDPAIAELRQAVGGELELLTRAATARLKAVPKKLPEFRSGRRLLDYQASAVARHLATQNAADFSVPGSGKTTVAIAYWAMLKRSDPSIGLWVVGPLSCFRPWEDEYLACIGIPPRTVRLQGSSSQRERLLNRTPDADLVLCSYQTAWRDQDRMARALSRRPWLFVLDEAHYVKSSTGVLAEAVRKLGVYAHRRMILTGTPMPRGPADLWSQFTFLWPSERLLGNAFQHEVLCRQDPDAVVAQLREKLAPYFHRTCKRDLRLDDPLVDYPVIPTSEIPASQRLVIRLLEAKTSEEDKYLSKNDRSFLRRWRRARLIRLLQAASNPALLADSLTLEILASVDDDSTDLTAAVADERSLALDDDRSDLAAALRKYRTGAVVPAKIRFVADRCREIVGKGRKVVLWTVFLGNVDALADALSDLRPLTISGQVPLYDDEDDEEGEGSRESRIELFKSVAERRVLIANMGACSESISLHSACQSAIYLERNFNAAQFVQSMDRIHRQGMPKGTRAHVILPSVPCAVERVVNRRLKDRQRRLYALLDDPMPVVGFDDEMHRGFFDIEDLGELDDLFEEVLAEIRSGRRGARKK